MYRVMKFCDLLYNTAVKNELKAYIYAVHREVLFITEYIPKAASVV